MAKYSTGGGGGGDDGGSCELCGRETGDLRRAKIAGADLLVCSDCAPHGESRGGGRGSNDGGAGGDDRKQRAARNAARMYDASKGDSRHWVEQGTDYEKDRLPYLVSDYGERVERGRQAVGLTVAELAAEIDADEDDVLAVEQGRAARAGVGGSTVRALEERLDVTLVEDT